MFCCCLGLVCQSAYSQLSLSVFLLLLLGFVFVVITCVVLFVVFTADGSVGPSPSFTFSVEWGARDKVEFCFVVGEVRLVRFSFIQAVDDG